MWPFFNILNFFTSSIKDRFNSGLIGFIASKLALFSVFSLKDEKLIKSKPTWKLKLANSILETWIFLPIIIKIDHYNSELYSFEFCAFFETQCIYVTLVADNDTSLLSVVSTSNKSKRETDSEFKSRWFKAIGNTAATRQSTYDTYLSIVAMLLSCTFRDISTHLAHETAQPSSSIAIGSQHNYVCVSKKIVIF